jgi:hypothetical protein
MLTEIGPPGRENLLPTPRHTPRAPRILGLRRPSRRRSLRRLLALGALAACLMGAMGFNMPAALAADRTTATRSAQPTPRHPAAAQPRREAASRPARSSTARTRVASRTHVRSSVPQIEASARMRDAPQELIPVIGPDMRGGMPTDPRAACLAATQPRRGCPWRAARPAHRHRPRRERPACLRALHRWSRALPGDRGAGARALRERSPAPEHHGRLRAGECPRARPQFLLAARSHALRGLGGAIMARWAAETGSWSEALRRWHGGSPASTQRLVCRVRAKMEVTNPDSTLFDNYSAATARSPSARAATARRISRRPAPIRLSQSD